MSSQVGLGVAPGFSIFNSPKHFQCANRVANSREGKERKVPSDDKG